MKLSKKQLHKFTLLSNRIVQRKMITWLAMLVMILCALPGLAQNIPVKGQVVDETGQPVARASVTVKGGGAGVTANDNGEYEITVAGNATLVISAINFTTLEVPVNNRQTININLAGMARTETEVIVVGYGTQRREAITGSVASINGDRMREVPAPNISQALQGRLAGVEMSQTSTRPGATMQIRVRGLRSLSADNNPLVVLDGIPFMGSLA
ncbi:MAG TPA: carboxypeptidase-like regulatory domain-containing protein, partial [Chitinophagaceae bacterium]|nr:carboxypeptidase-like regulatory domain-containing protein [Chitinophagaceae bacterium]